MVSCLSIIMSRFLFWHILFDTLQLQDKRQDFKEKWENLSAEDREPFEKKKRDHLARQDVMKECIADALQKIKGGNCVRSYASLAKVKCRRVYMSCKHEIIWPSSCPCLHYRQQGTGAIRAQSRNGCRASLTSVCTRREFVRDCLKQTERNRLNFLSTCITDGA